MRQSLAISAMKRFVFGAAAIAAMGTLPLLADFSYDQTSQITGGAMLRVMHVAGAFSKKGKKLTEPIVTTVSIKGNRMLRKTADDATLIDLDQQTITTIHFANKTYSVETFEQLKKQLADMAEQMRSRKEQNPQQADFSFDVKVNDTGQTKMIQGNNAHEMIMTMTMTASSTDPDHPGQGALNMVNHLWIAPNIAGYGEVREFQRRMADALGWVPGENPMMNRPDMAKAMAQAYKEASKLDGMPLMTIMRMGAAGQGAPDSSSASAQAPPPQDSDSQQQRETAPPPTSVGDAVSGALAGHFGFGRHKKRSNSNSETAAQNTPSPEPAASPQPEQQSQESEASLMELTSQVTSYNSNAVDPAVFVVPSDFAKVEEDPTKSRKHR